MGLSPMYSKLFPPFNDFLHGAVDFLFSFFRRFFKRFFEFFCLSLGAQDNADKSNDRDNYADQSAPQKHFPAEIDIYDSGNYQYQYYSSGIHNYII